MFNTNGGYVGAKRSVRSQEAINSYEVPISTINKSLIKDFINEYEKDFSEDDLIYLKKLSVAKWKYVTKEKVSASSWHHVGSYFNETNHYNLKIVAEKIIEIKEILDDEYESYQESQKKEKTCVKYGVIKVQVWVVQEKNLNLKVIKKLLVS